MRHFEPTPDQRLGIERAVGRGLRALRIPPPIRLSEWADKHFYLSAESSYVESDWKCWPFQRAILDCMGHDDIAVVDLRKSARVGYTKMFLAAVCYFAQHKRRNQVVYQPTDEDRDEFVTTEVEPMLGDVKVMHGIFPRAGTRNKHNTTRFKKFLTGALHLRGGKAAKNYRRLTVDVVYYDELDGFDRDIENEGSPTKLGDKRLEGATFPKSIRGTTPKLKHQSNIEDCEASADQRYRYHVPCFHCREEITIEFGGEKARHGFKWVNGDPDSVRHVCRHCGAAMTQAEYKQVWEAGRWVADDGTWIDGECRFFSAAGPEQPPPRHVAFHIWAGYSPQAAWPGIVRDFLSASEVAKRGDHAELKTFVNTTLGETWEVKGDGADENELLKRAGAYDSGTVPRGCLVLTAGVDVQDNRFEVSVWGWGEGEEQWLIDHVVLDANPADERDWDKLDGYLLSRFKQEHLGGASSLPIEAVAVDTGGHFTHQAYAFCRVRAHRRVYATHGSSLDGKPVKFRSSVRDVNYRGVTIKAGVRLWEIGTDTAKDLIDGRLKVTQPGPGYVHFPRDVTRSYCEGLAAEVRLLVKTPSGSKYRWQKRRARNEPLDCAVLALFAAHTLDLNRYTGAMWQRLRNAAEPEPDLFALQQQIDAGRAARDEPPPSRAAVERETSPAATTAGADW